MKLSSKELKILKYKHMKMGMSESEAEKMVASVIAEVQKVNKQVHIKKIIDKKEKKKDAFKTEFEKLRGFGTNES